MGDLLQQLRNEAAELPENGDLVLRAADEIERLLAALKKSAETFADFEKGLKLLNRPLLAEACQIAGAAAREALREKSRDGPAECRS